MTIKTPLDPYAPSFVPGCRWRSRIEGGSGTDRNNEGSSCSGTHRNNEGSCEHGLLLTDLPVEVHEYVIRKLRDPKDVVRCKASCRRLYQLPADTPAYVCLPGTVNKKDALTGEGCTQLQDVCTALPGIEVLDLRRSAVVDSDVVWAVGHLAKLAVLHLTWSSKISSALVRLTLEAQGGLRGIHAIGLQRCYQLNASSLMDVLTAAGMPGSKLTCAALSHLPLASWPEGVPSEVGQLGMGMGLAPNPHPLPVGNLLALALNNCQSLTTRGLKVLAVACPRLQYLLLGGSTFVMGKDECSARGLSYVLNPGSSQDARVLAAQLMRVLEGLRELRAIDVTFFPEGVASNLRRLLQQSQCKAAVWDLAEPECIQHLHDLWKSSKRANSLVEGETSAILVEAAANCSSASRSTPLHIAAMHDSCASIEALVEMGAQLDARDVHGCTPVFVACSDGMAAGLSSLLAAGANMHLRNAAGESPLYIAALCGRDAAVDVLLSQICRKDLETEELWRSYDDWTPLMAAVVGKHPTIAEKLLEFAAPYEKELVTACNRRGWSAVHLAAFNGSHELVALLVRYGGRAMATTPGHDGKTPLDLARQHGGQQVEQLLLNPRTPKGQPAGVRKNAKQRKGRASDLRLAAAQWFGKARPQACGAKF